MIVRALHFHTYGKNEVDVVRIVTILIGFNKFCPPFQRDEKWQLNSSNDWWLNVYPETVCTCDGYTGYAELRYRYHRDESEWLKLRTVIEFVLRS